MSATYGKRVETLEDQDLKEIYGEMGNIMKIFSRGLPLVEEYPVLAKLIPKSMQWWRPEAERLHQIECALWLRLWNELAEKVQNGTAPYCYVRGFMEQKYKELGLSDLQGAYVAGSMIEVDTVFQMSLTDRPAQIAQV
jgi:hypothetical protein